MYKDLWKNKNIFYKLTHFKESPNKFGFSQIEYNELEEKIEKISAKKSR